MTGMEITFKDLYDLLQRHAEKLTAVEGKLGELTARINERLDSWQEKIDDHERRIRSLEKLAWRLIGAFTIVNMLAVTAEILLARHK